MNLNGGSRTTMTVSENNNNTNNNGGSNMKIIGHDISPSRCSSGSTSSPGIVQFSSPMCQGAFSPSKEVKGQFHWILFVS